MAFEIIDSHVHFFSRQFFRALVGQMTPPGDPDTEFKKLEEKAGIEIPDESTKVHTQKWISQMETHKVAKMVVLASLPSEAEAVGKAIVHSEKKMAGYTLLNPMAPDAEDRLYQAIDFGLKGILLFPVMHHFSFSNTKLDPLLKKAENEGLMVLVHFGLLSIKMRDLLGMDRNFDLTYGNPLALQVAANAYPKLRFIIPHFGCGFLRETLMLGSQCPNVFVDTSSSNSWLVTQPGHLSLADVFNKTKAVFGPERILFGTDSSVFPRGWRKDILALQISAMEEAGFSDIEMQSVLSGNIKKLIKF